MRIQYCSDLHLEFEENRRYLEAAPLSVSGDILILAGDIVPLHDEFLSNPFFNTISKNFKQIYWVPGNHEFYYKNISEYSKSFNIQIYSNINIVHNIQLYFEDIHFVFSTLWSKISNGNEKIIERSVSDFECISTNDKKFKASDFNRLHDESLDFVKQCLTGNLKKTVVVTHHLPSVLCNLDIHNNSTINEAFCVDLTDYIYDSNVNFWIHGHNHFNHNPLIIGKTIMLTNQLGYVHLNEAGNFKNNAYFSV
jgi:Icc-related predicted phosphoesterase